MNDQVIELMQDLYAEAGDAYWRFSDICKKIDIDSEELEKILEELEVADEVQSQWNGKEKCYVYCGFYH